MSAGSTTVMIESYLAKISSGDEQAVDQLVDCAFDRLVNLCERIVGRMVGGRADIRSSDVFQEVFLRLKGALLKENVNPKDVGEFLGLAARHIRYQVLDMLRQSKRVAAKGDGIGGGEGTLIGGAQPDASNFELWITFYEAFEELPEEERVVADLLWTWVEGKGSPAVPNLTQYEAAEVLGVSRDKVKDLWRSARIKLATKCKDFSPFAGGE